MARLPTTRSGQDGARPRGAGTTSMNVRDVGRTLMQCIRCTEAVHMSKKCRTDDGFQQLSNRYGICGGHAEGDDSDCEDAELRELRTVSTQGLRMTFEKAPQHLWGTEPPPEKDSSDEDDEDEEDEDDEDDEADAEETGNKRKAKAHDDEGDRQAKRAKA